MANLSSDSFKHARFLALNASQHHRIRRLRANAAPHRISNAAADVYSNSSNSLTIQSAEDTVPIQSYFPSAAFTIFLFHFHTPEQKIPLGKPKIFATKKKTRSNT